ncbi:hypothetical protein FRB96_000280 [Tulasnella sp. 330]|nr:hypothetical protein FRB96_000280 [Tulasnella sp. 330]
MPAETVVPRPKRLTPNIQAIAYLPQRLMNTPPAPRSWKISPDFEVKLDDILANKHRFPIALKDFEEYLLFTEHTVENLYFVVWVRDYTHAYEAYLSMSAEPPEDQGVAVGKLTLLFARALATFFDTPSNLALNLPHALVMPIRDVAGQSSLPPPEVLQQAHEYVREMLKESLKRFVKTCHGNSDTNRAWFAYMNGWVTAIVVVGITILGIFLGWPRMTRLASYPILALAIATIFASTQGGVFALVDSRQLCPLELAAPRLPDTAARQDSMTSNRDHQQPNAPHYEADDPLKPTSTNSFSVAVELEEGNFSTMDHRPGSVMMLTHDKQPSTVDGYPPLFTDEKTKYCYTASFIPDSISGQPMTSITTPEPTYTTGTSSPFVFDFDTPPVFYPIPSSHITNVVPPDPVSFHTRRSKSVDVKTMESQTTTFFSDPGPVIAELARVSDPIVMRSQWEIFARSLLYGTSVATLIMVVLMAVPCSH